MASRRDRCSATSYLKLEKLALVQEYRARTQAARQRFALIRSSLAALSLENAKAQMALSQRLLDGIEHSIQESLDGPDGPDQDHDFPHRLVFSRVVQEPEFAFGLWDSANELSLNWQRQATTYLASLTLFAIALYLFGQSLSMGRTRAAFILVFFSCGLVLLGIISSTVVACESVNPESGPTPQQCHDEHTSGNDLATEAARHFVRLPFALLLPSLTTIFPWRHRSRAPHS